MNSSIDTSDCDDDPKESLVENLVDNDNKLMAEDSIIDDKIITTMKTINDNNNNEILPNDLVDDVKSNQINDDNLKLLTEQLKIHIDLFYKQLNLQRNGIQMFNNFIKQNNSSNNNNNTIVLNNEKFQRNYRFWNKKCRKLRKQQPKTSPYDILQKLYKVSPEEDANNLEKTISSSLEIGEISHDICITENDIEVSLTTPEQNDGITSNIATIYFVCSLSKCKEIFCNKELLISHLYHHHKVFQTKTVLDHRTQRKKSVVVLKRENKDEDIMKMIETELMKSNDEELNHCCFVRGCNQRFSNKDEFMNHLFQHSNTTISSSVTATATKRKTQPTEKVTSNSTLSSLVKRKSTRKQQNPTKKPQQQKSSKRKNQKENRVSDDEEELVDGEEQEEEEEFQEIEATDGGSIRKSRRIVKMPKNAKKSRAVIQQQQQKKAKNVKSRKSSKTTGKTSSQAKNIACDFDGCSYVAKNQSVLKCHQVIHSPERPFKCDQCPQAFKYMCSLQAHQKIHFGIRYHCRFENCQANYSDERILRKHVAIVHTKSAPRFNCTWIGCQYNSCRMDLLRKHYKVHTGERPYSCIWPGCDKTFKTLSSQHGHMLIHKNERQYKCTWPGCNYSCNLGGNLRKHEAIHEKKRS